MFKSINGIEVIDLERIITPDEILEDGNSELSLRPQKINEYIGQDNVKGRLFKASGRVFVGEGRFGGIEQQ